MLTAILRESQFNWPGKRKQQVVPERAAETYKYKK